MVHSLSAQHLLEHRVAHKPISPCRVAYEADAMWKIGKITKIFFKKVTFPTLSLS